MISSCTVPIIFAPISANLWGSKSSAFFVMSAAVPWTGELYNVSWNCRNRPHWRITCAFWLAYHMIYGVWYERSKSFFVWNPSAIRWRPLWGMIQNNIDCNISFI
jgi:hypothetical protein